MKRCWTWENKIQLLWESLYCAILSNFFTNFIYMLYYFLKQCYINVNLRYHGVIFKKISNLVLETITPYIIKPFMTPQSYEVFNTFSIETWSFVYSINHYFWDYNTPSFGGIEIYYMDFTRFSQILPYSY